MPPVVVVLVKNGTEFETQVVPSTVKVEYGTQTVTWTAAGPNTRFASSNYFSWKTNPPPLGGAIPTRSTNGESLTLSYENNGSSSTWEYGLTIENNETSKPIDPEIDNGPPR